MNVMTSDPRQLTEAVARRTPVPPASQDTTVEPEPSASEHLAE